MSAHEPGVPWATPRSGLRSGPATGAVVAVVAVLAVLVLGSSVLTAAVVAGAVGPGLPGGPGGGGREGLAAVGAPADEAGCDDVVADPGRGISTHVGPGTTTPSPDVDYDTVPPSTGPHLASPVFPAQQLYEPGTSPPVEALVHNLEHGYTVLWYDADLSADDVDDLREIASLAGQNPSTAGKFVVAAWDDEHGALPADRPVALSHWTAVDGGRRLLCAQVSGEAVEDFVTAFPSSDSPEPNGP